MDPVIHPEAPSFPGRESGQRLRAFRAMDAFAVEAMEAARLVAKHDADGLAVEIRRAVVYAGSALFAACASAPGSEGEREGMKRARARLLEGRYHLYLARRLGLFDVRRYRAVSFRHEAALREVEAALEPPPASRGGRAPP